MGFVLFWDVTQRGVALTSQKGADLIYTSAETSSQASVLLFCSLHSPTRFGLNKPCSGKLSQTGKRDVY
jgi:hypothetical protein